jgi:polyhydroxybutyrate depolymerase
LHGDFGFAAARQGGYFHPVVFVKGDATMARCRFAFALALSVLLLPGTSSAQSQEHKRSGGGRDRSYLLYRPATLNRQQSVPLVIVLHGGFGSGAQAQKAYGWDDMASTHGFAVAYPDGIGRSWNAGGTCCGPAFRDHVEDVAFLDQLIATVAADENIDRARIYITGISNGAAMAYRYACDGKTKVAAIGSVAGTLPGGCANPRPMSVMEIHGLEDRNIPFAGGVGSKGVTQINWPAVETTLDVFRRADRCDAATMQKNGVVTHHDWTCADGRAISLITIADAGHQWPGAVARHPLIERLLRLDPPSAALNATEALWRFFESHAAH